LSWPVRDKATGGKSTPPSFATRAGLSIPQLVELHMQKRFPFDKAVKFFNLNEINQAAGESKKGGTIKPVVRMA
jgi:Zn-dependent alcohol dehydrogenase